MRSQLKRLTSVTDANGHTTSFGYNARDLRTSQTLPLGQTETTVYDAVGNAARITDFNGKTTTYHYDALNRLDTITPDASLNQPSILFTFTPTGQRASMSDGSGTTTYGYDAQDRLTSKATPQGTLSYTYDPNGNVLSVRSSNANGVALDYRYDALNRLDQVTDTRLSPGVTSSGYDPASNLTTTTQPNGVLTTATYNDVNRLTHLASTKNGSTLTSVAYTLRPSGLRTQIVEQNDLQQTSTRAYGYDDAQRLLSETITGSATPTGSISYGYDHTGNRLSRSSSVTGIPSSTSNYDANDRMAGVSYDNNGNITAADGVSYSYDYANRISATSTGVSIQYNGDGVRVSETVAGITTQYLVDENNPTGSAQVVKELRGGQVQQRYS